MTDLLEPLRTYGFFDDDLGFALDVSQIQFRPRFFEEMEPTMQEAFRAMKALEEGAVANPDERRRVGHYWLRAPELAPEDCKPLIEQALTDIRSFARGVHAGAIRPEKQAKFERVLVVGIGGSALGPQLVSQALGSSRDKMRIAFLDNTDPDGFDRALDAIGTELDKTLTVVISKSGGTKETRNGMVEVAAAYQRAGLRFSKHAVAVTGADSALDRTANHEGWIATFPMWDWVGGRTSVLSAVGLLPAELQGFDVAALLRGARDMDTRTRRTVSRQNPAALLALSWYAATGGVGRKDMVVLPYKDRLELFSRYLQQLVMESIGKGHDLDGRPVEQGIAVYGNKGSTDQHAYVQQLRDGVDNFFVTFIEVLRDREVGRPTMEVEPGVTSGDYLFGFLQGTRKALSDRGRPSLTITVSDVSARAVGELIALYERAVGLYAKLVHVNAYHQPGVEAGKKAAHDVLELQARVLSAVRQSPTALTAADVAKLVDSKDAPTVFAILRHAAANPEKAIRQASGTGVDATFTRA